MLTCPKCNKDAHPVCSNRGCVCYSRIPKGEKPLIYRPMVTWFVVPKPVFGWLWRTLRHPEEWGLYELEECPYCGHRMMFDAWGEREMEQSFPDRPVSDLDKFG